MVLDATRCPHSLAATHGRRAGGHRQQGQALPRPRRPHLDDGRGLPRASRSRRCSREPAGAVVVATSNPGKRARPGGGAPAHAGTFISKVQGHRDRLDLGPPALGGASARRHARSRSRPAAATRARPDTTWSDWSAAYTQAEGDAGHQRARALPAGEGRRCTGSDGRRPVLDSALRRVPAAQPAAAGADDHRASRRARCSRSRSRSPARPRSWAWRRARARAAAGRRRRRPRAACRPPRATAASCTRRASRPSPGRRTTPTATPSAYDVHYRRVGDTRFRLLRKGLTEPVLAWDTTTVPNGRYVISVTASDAPSQPASRWRSPATRRARPSTSTTRRPSVTALAAAGGAARVRVMVQGRQQPRAPGRVLGGRRPLAGGPSHATASTTRSRRPTRSRPRDLAGPGPHMVVVRATDLLGNVATARVEIP